MNFLCTLKRYKLINGFLLDYTQVEQLSESLSTVLDFIERNPEKLTGQETFLFIAASLHVRITLVLTCSYKREEKELKYLESQEKICAILSWTSRSVKKSDFIF